MKIVRAIKISTFMYTEEFTVFLGNKGIATVRAGKPERRGDNITGRECLTADFALVLPVATVVVIDEVMRSTTEWTDGIFGNGFTIAALNRFDCFTILPLVVFKKELPVLFDKGFDDRKFINLEFLILWGMGIVKSPLFQRNISANKVKKPTVLLVKVLNCLK